MAGSWRDIDRDLVRAKTLPAEAIHEAAKAYLVPENAVVTYYQQDLEASEPTPAPAPLPAHLGTPSTSPTTGPTAMGVELPSSWKDLEYEKRDFEIPSGADARRELSNGIRAFVVPTLGDPIVRVSALVLGGSAEDPKGKEGLTEITASLLGESGIEGLTSEALKEHLENMVASISTASDVDTHSVTLSVFPADLDEGLRILRLLLGAPDLDVTAFTRIKDAMLSRIDAEDTRLRGVTTRLYRKLLWGDVPETRRATRESVEAITLEDVRARIAAVTGPARTMLAVSGDVKVAEVTAR
jgi:predicted Zn-dependent peptidase